MGYLEFSSEKADYVLEVGCGIERFSGATNDHFSGIDALVLERTVGKDFKQHSIKDILESSNTHVDFAKEKEIPIFFVDAAPTPVGIMRNLLSSYPTILIVMPFIAYAGATKKEIPNWMSKYLATLSFLEQSPVEEFRNAWGAQMLENYVAPIVAGVLESEGSDKKPKIGIRYDAGHIGLKANILSEKKRNFTIKNWCKANFRPYAGIFLESLAEFYIVQEQKTKEGKIWKTIIAPVDPKSYDL